MALINYPKYKVTLSSDSKKTQGLQTGDIIRRQYKSGNDIIYSLMCVLDFGVDANTQESYFIGALLDGDAPTSDQLLDFVRITNLFDEERSGALYLTASDEGAPYMDVIDNIARNSSLSYPEGIGETAESQYVFEGSGVLTLSYASQENTRSRVCTITKKTSGSCQLKQNFTQLIESSDYVVVSYWIKASAAKSLAAKLGYTNGAKVDATITVNATTDWVYQFHVIRTDNSGRFARSFSMDFSDLATNQSVYIADFNVVLLSNLTSFAEASQSRVGKLNGIVDPVFGELDGYGARFQKVYATQAVHISGTITAGDANGFGSTFYAGKIHTNAFVNSLDIATLVGMTETTDKVNPTGTGKQYLATSEFSFTAQTKEWLSERVGELYCFSFWAYSNKPCSLTIKQNDQIVGTAAINIGDVFAWKRYHCVFKLAEVGRGKVMYFNIIPTFFDVTTEDASEYSSSLYFSSPQLEQGDTVTQYQPTDDIITECDDYGAWFNKGGIGGTIQNPLLKLDENGDILGRNDSFKIKNADGSGHLAQGNITWDKNGNVTFGNAAKITWNNLDSSVTSNINRSISIIGQDTFTYQGDGSTELYTPSSITLDLSEVNISSTAAQRHWYYLKDGEYYSIANSTKILTISPTASYWSDSTIVIKCVVSYDDKEYSDTITLRKQYITGYTLQITSEQGTSFINGACNTVLKANVYYQGRLLSDDEVQTLFTFKWLYYHLPDTTNEVADWWTQQKIDRTQQSITLNYNLTGQDLIECEIEYK